MFRKARQNRIFQDMVEQIQDAIIKGTLKPGDKLPPERELTEMFGASRGTLREALRILEQKGLITIKTGVAGGAVVNALSTDQMSESLNLLIRYQKVSLKDLAEFREGVEGLVAGLAAERAKGEHISRLEDSHWDEFIEADNRIHLMLAHIAGNPIYESVLTIVYQNINLYFGKFLSKEESLMKENYQDLVEIVAAVKSGQSAKANLLVQNHVYRFNRLMEERGQKFET
ncbi:MAG: FadR family transcriptional regulator [Deltaproteobacteria bacterium]|nr:FadR family transcriptional regulator [Deltaproteobacteria bacterium]